MLVNVSESECSQDGRDKLIEKGIDGRWPDCGQSALAHLDVQSFSLTVVLFSMSSSY